MANEEAAAALKVTASGGIPRLPRGITGQG